jgi:hypothetical protein
MDSKSILTSKTFWSGVIMALVPLFPPAAALIAANPAAAGALAGVIAVAMRSATDGSVHWPWAAPSEGGDA